MFFFHISRLNGLKGVLAISSLLYIRGMLTIHFFIQFTEHVLESLDFLHFCHRNIQFALKEESENVFFLDIHKEKSGN